MELWPSDRYFPYLAIRQGETASCYFVAMLISHLIHGRSDVREIAHDRGKFVLIDKPFAGAPMRIDKGYPMRNGLPLDCSDAEILAVLHKALAIDVLDGCANKCIECRQEYLSAGSPCRCHPNTAARMRVPKWDRLNWGYPHVAYEWLSGQKTRQSHWHDLSLRSIHNQVGQMGPTVLISRQDLDPETRVNTDIEGHRRRLIAAHAYSVIQVGLSYDYVLLRDPYGDDGDSEYVMLSEIEVKHYFGYISSGKVFRSNPNDAPVAGGVAPVLKSANPQARWITPGAVILAGTCIVRCIQIHGNNLALLVGDRAVTSRSLRRPGDQSTDRSEDEVTYVDLSLEAPVVEVRGLRIEFLGSEIQEVEVPFARALLTVEGVRHSESREHAPALVE